MISKRFSWNREWTHAAPCGCKVVFHPPQFKTTVEEFKPECAHHRSTRNRTRFYWLSRYVLYEAMHGYCDHHWTLMPLGDDEGVDVCEKCGMELPGSYREGLAEVCR